MKAYHRTLTICLLLGLTMLWLIPLRTASASLGEQDNTELTESLEILSTGWVQVHVDRANSILSKAIYTAADWQEFFTAYFGAHPFTDELRDYLSYPVFQWFDADVRLNLQLGLISPLEGGIQRIMAAHGNELGAVLASDAALRETLFNSHRFLNAYFHDGVIDPAARQSLDEFYITHINAYGGWLKHTTALDTAAHPYVAALRAQVAMNLIDAQPLTEARKQLAAEVLGLTGAHAAVWRDDTLLLMDNHGLDGRQIDLIDRYVQSLPAGIQDLRYVTVNDLLGNTADQYEPLTNRYGVDIAGLPIGSAAENDFPADVPPVFVDQFAIALAHEVNHYVDAALGRTRPDLAQRRDGLIAHAGPDCHHYLRSNFANGYFVGAPREFYASIASLWMADTQHTLDLALTQWRAGHDDPISQFLFFAEVYSQGGNTVPFYRLDAQGQLARVDVPVERDDSRGLITVIRAAQPYRFVLDDTGDVVSVQHYEFFLPAVQR